VIPSFHLLHAIESCPELFSRYGGHAHAVGFALPSANIEKLREHLDGYARARLTPADFEPQLEFDRELPLGEVTPRPLPGASFARTLWHGESRTSFRRLEECG